jgi:hypothetical protein
MSYMARCRVAWRRFAAEAAQVAKGGAGATELLRAHRVAKGVRFPVATPEGAAVGKTLADMALAWCRAPASVRATLTVRLAAAAEGVVSLLDEATPHCRPRADIDG